MAERKIPKYTPPVLSFPMSQPSTAVPELLSQVSRFFDKQAKEAIKEWELSEIKEAKREGLSAGFEEEVKYRDPGTLTGEAFNQKALSSQLKNIEITNKQVFNTLSISEASNPDGWLQKTNEHIEKVVQELKESPVSAYMAPVVKKQMQLAQFTYGREIAKQYNADLNSEVKASTETLISTIEADAYRDSGGIFSKDFETRSMTFNTFALDMKELDVQLHTTVGGEPVYTAEEIRRKKLEVRSNFYMRGLQHAISSGILSDERIYDVLDGTITVDVPGTEMKINILDEVGTKKYDRHIKQYYLRTERERLDTARKEEAQIEKETKIRQDVNGFTLLTSIMDGSFEGTTDTVIELVKSGYTDASWGRRCTTKLTSDDPDLDDTDAVVSINTMIVNGEDATEELKKAALNLTNRTYITLSKANSLTQARKTKGIHKEHIRMLEAEFKGLDPFSAFNPAVQRNFNDMKLTYWEDVEAGMDAELAFEKGRSTAKHLLDIYNAVEYREIQPYLIYDNIGQLDMVGTLTKFVELKNTGKLTSSEVIKYIGILEQRLIPKEEEK